MKIASAVSSSICFCNKSISALWSAMTASLSVTGSLGGGLLLLRKVALCLWALPTPEDSAVSACRPPKLLARSDVGDLALGVNRVVIAFGFVRPNNLSLRSFIWNYLKIHPPYITPKRMLLFFHFAPRYKIEVVTQPSQVTGYVIER